MIFISKETHMKSVVSALGAAVPIIFSNVAVAGPSAKFAATYTDTPSLSARAFVSCSTTDGATDSCSASSSDTGHTLAMIKVPQDKELLVGVSAEIGLSTFGAVKGKNGGSGTAVADAEATVTIHACPVDGGDCTEAAPGGVTLSKRVQELSAKLGGVIEECTFTAELEGDTTVDISEDCTVNDEEVALLLSTVAANHFNFVLPNLPQGEYEIKATFSTAADADVYLCDPQAYANGDYTTLDCDESGEVAGAAEAISVINKSMVTVQTVRAAKGGIIDSEIID
jgi:hypothetical protein